MRAADASARHSRHSGRDEAVEAARQLGGGAVVVLGLRGEELARYGNGKDVVADAPPAGQAAPAAQAAPPRRPGMRLSQLLTLTDQTDETGRLLLEDSAPRQAVKRAERAGISMATVEATYADTPSRLGGRMNAAAYDALRRDTAAILDGFAWLADHHRAAAPTETGTPQRLFAVSYLGVSLVHVLFHRADDPVAAYGELPSYIASIFKASRGLFSFSVAMENDLGPTATLTAAEVVGYAEDKRQLVRPDTGRVCAAPTRLIERTIDVILTGRGADASRSTLGEMLDFDVLWRFYQLQDRFGQTLSTYRVVVDNLTRTGLANDPQRLLRSVIPDGPARGKTFGQFTEETLKAVNDVQAGMNRALGRRDNANKVTLPELMQML